MADANGAFTFAKAGGFTGPQVTATATDAAGNTSEFGLLFSLQPSCLVTSTADGGAGTLRECLLNAAAGRTIAFDPAVFPPANPATIALTSSLPAIVANQLTIDGSDAGVTLDGSEIWGGQTD